MKCSELEKNKTELFQEKDSKASKKIKTICNRRISSDELENLVVPEMLSKYK